MKKFLYVLKEIILYIWQLPQNLLGLIFLLFYKKEAAFYKKNGRTFYGTPEMPSGITLGNYIIINAWYAKQPEDNEYRDRIMRHEYGHSIDSRIWGPLYLIVIGLPSIMGNLWNRWFHKDWTPTQKSKWYYNLPWERSAERKGGVVRVFKDE